MSTSRGKNDAEAPGGGGFVVRNPLPDPDPEVGGGRRDETRRAGQEVLGTVLSDHGGSPIMIPRLIIIEGRGRIQEDPGEGTQMLPDLFP